MRKFLAIVLLVIVGAAGSLVLLNRAPRAPLDLEVVSSRPLDKMNGKEFILVTLAIKNRTRDAVIFDKIDDIQAMVRGDWIEVDQSFTVPIQVADKDFQKRFVVPGGAEACRLRCDYRLRHFPSVT